MTRLHFNLRDEDIVDDTAVNAVEGVLGVQRRGGQYQVIIGQNVPDVYREVCRAAGIDEGKAIDENLDSAVAPDLKTVVSKVLDYLSGSIIPMIPVIMVAGLFKTIQVIPCFCSSIRLEAPASSGPRLPGRRGLS